MKRRDLLTNPAMPEREDSGPVRRKGRIKQCLMTNNFGPAFSVEDMCQEAVRLGCKGFDAERKIWPTLRRYGLVPSLAFPVVTPPPFADGTARRELHAPLEQLANAEIDICASEGCPSIPIMGGQRRGMSREEALDNSVAFFNRVKAHAEDKSVNLCTEVMNKLDRPDQAFDHLHWAIELCKRVNSPRVKVLFDIYHVQITDGDICRDIRENIQWVCHFHTGGVPGRHEIDDTQELNYRFIAKTIADLGFTGYVTHEWTPAPGHDPLKSLAQAIEIMDA